MTTVPERELELLSPRRQGLAERTRQLLAAVFEVKTLRAYKAVFLDKDGALTPDGERVLADMAKAAGIGKVRRDATGDELQFREGRRAVLLHVLARLDGANLARAARRLTKIQENQRENDGE